MRLAKNDIGKWVYPKGHFRRAMGHPTELQDTGQLSEENVQTNRQKGYQYQGDSRSHRYDGNEKHIHDWPLSKTCVRIILVRNEMRKVRAVCSVPFDSSHILICRRW